MKNNSTYIIAEIGVNHNGSLKFATNLITAAHQAGVNAVKFQTFKTENLVSLTAPKADYQKKNTDKAETQFEMLKSLELSENDHIELISFCRNYNLDFLSTPFGDVCSEMLIKRLGLKTVKISSGDLTNAPLLLKIAKLGADVILSTGMSNNEEITEALGVLAFGYLNIKSKPSLSGFMQAFKSKEGSSIIKQKVSLLHCTSEYPAPFDEINLNAMVNMKNHYGCKTGLSDHSDGIIVPIAAVAMGAEIIEKHITLDKTLNGPDHKASLDPIELTNMVRAIRNIEFALGSGVKCVSKSEMKNKNIVRKSIVAKKVIKNGETFSEENLTTKRPENGLLPIKMWEIIGKIAKRDYSVDDVIEI